MKPNQCFPTAIDLNTDVGKIGLLRTECGLPVRVERAAHPRDQEGI